MTAFVCASCGVKAKQVASFCPKCGQPTPYASVDELREWDLRQWRGYQQRAVAETPPAWDNPTPLVRAADVRESTNGHAPPPNGHAPPAPAAQAEPAPAAPQPAPASNGSPSNTERADRARQLLEQRRTARRAREAEQEAVRLRALADDPSHYQFVYEACTECDRTDWLLRTGRNEDESWNYWCVRCSRSFKTDLRIPHGRLPFVVGGSILTALAVLANVL